MDLFQDKRFLFVMHTDEHGDPHVHVKSRKTNKDYKFRIDNGEPYSDKVAIEFISNEYGISRVRKTILNHRIEWYSEWKKHVDVK